MKGLHLAAFACIATSASTVFSAPILELTATPGPSGVALVLSVSNDAGERPDVLGFDIYRIEFNPDSPEGCFSSTKITDNYLARPFGTPGYSFQTDDDTVVEGRAYEYFLEGYPNVSVGTHWSLGFDHDATSPVITTGRALIASVVRVRDFGSGIFLEGCADECGSLLWGVGSAPSEIVNTGSWRLFGTVRPIAELPYGEWVVEAAEPGDCPDFAITPSTWSNVKGLYR